MKLLRLGPAGVQKLIDDMDKECEAIKKNALTLSWYMRGGATYEDVLNMSAMERQAISTLVEEHLETTKKSQMPFF